MIKLTQTGCTYDFINFETYMFSLSHKKSKKKKGRVIQRILFYYLFNFTKNLFDKYPNLKYQNEHRIFNFLYDLIISFLFTSVKTLCFSSYNGSQLYSSIFLCRFMYIFSSFSLFYAIISVIV